MSAQSQRAADVAERVIYTCECGSKRQATAKRYERFNCGECGTFWWALRPKRNGPLVGFKWPGPDLSREQLAELERLAA